MKPELNTIHRDKLDEFQLQQTDSPESPMGEPIQSLPSGESDQEGAMAKADLFKLSNYSYKLFKKIEDNQQLESWVQAKITKAADYIASVYHYLEYEMKISEYGSKLESSDMYSESQKAVIQQKLNEARVMVRFLKIAQAQKLSESKSSMPLDGHPYHYKSDNELKYIQKDAGEAAKNMKGVSGKSEAKYLDQMNDASTVLYHRKNGGKQLSKKDEQLDELSNKTLGSYVKKASAQGVSSGRSAGVELGAGDSKRKDVYNRHEDKAEKRLRGIGKAVDKLGESKPSSDLTKTEKSSVVKKAKAGKDIGKPGKNFDKVAKKAGGGEKGKKIAAAAMWKNIKENTEMAFGEGVYEKDEQLDELTLTPWKKKSPFSKAGYKGVADRQKSKMQDAENATDAADEAGDNAGIKKAGQDWKSAKAKKDKALDKADKAKFESLNESADLNAIKFLSGIK